MWTWTSFPRHSPRSFQSVHCHVHDLTMRPDLRIARFSSSCSRRIFFMFFSFCWSRGLFTQAFCSMGSRSFPSKAYVGRAVKVAPGEGQPPARPPARTSSFPESESASLSDDDMTAEVAYSIVRLRSSHQEMA